MTPGSARRIGTPGALLLAALRTAQTARHVVDARIPAAQTGQCVGLRVSFMAAGAAMQYQRVLAELVAEFDYLKICGHPPIFDRSARRRPSSILGLPILYEAERPFKSWYQSASCSRRIGRPPACSYAPYSVARPGARARLAKLSFCEAIFTACPQDSEQALSRFRAGGKFR